MDSLIDIINISINITSHIYFSRSFGEDLLVLLCSVQFTVSQSCLTLCNPTNRSTPGLPVHHQLPEFTQTHVHRVSDTCVLMTSVMSNSLWPHGLYRLPAPLSMRILQERTLEWDAIPSSRGSSWPRDSTHVSYASCTGRRGLYHDHHLGSPTNVNNTLQTLVTMLHIRSSDFIHHLTA